MNGSLKKFYRNNNKNLSCAFTSDILYFQIFWIIQVSHSTQKEKEKINEVSNDG